MLTSKYLSIALGFLSKPNHKESIELISEFILNLCEVFLMNTINS